MGLFAIFFAASCLWAGTHSVNPDRTVVPLIKIYDDVRILRARGEPRSAPARNYSVRTSQLTHQDRLRNGNGRISVPAAVLDRARALARGVLLAIPGEYVVNRETVQALGTAFHVGGSLILTNQHVLSPTRENTTRCDDLEVRTADNRSGFHCRRVVHCEPNLDMCLVEMQDQSWGLGNSARLSALPTLPLRVDELPSDTAEYTAIGNFGGFGMHYSVGRGLAPAETVLYRGQTASPSWHFYAPVSTGNSGGPLINAAGEAVGLIAQQSPRPRVGEQLGSRVNSRAFNVAVPLARILGRLREVLGDSNPHWQTVRAHMRGELP